MAIYAVGDIQGCLKPLKRLLKTAGFQWGADTLWVVGDIVNRGPDSLKALRYLYRHRADVVCVLGNHDLHLLAVANGLRKADADDTLDKILKAPDRDELLHWLRHRPLIHSAGNYTMAHAGIPPIWTVEEAHSRAAEVESALRGSEWRKFLARMYGNAPAGWSDDLTGHRRLRVIANYFTRMRFIYADGRLDLKSKGKTADKGAVPWFAHKGFARADNRLSGRKIIFGHWAALQGKVKHKNLIALDTGCVWGGKLSMCRLLEDGSDEGKEKWFSCRCRKGR